jgi:hypothetical protein
MHDCEGAEAPVTTPLEWYPNSNKESWSPECRFDVHSFCGGNVDLYAGGTRYEQKRCFCLCHPSRSVRRLDWPHS